MKINLFNILLFLLIIYIKLYDCKILKAAINLDQLDKFLNIIRGKKSDDKLNCKSCTGFLQLLKFLLKHDFQDNTIEKLAFEVCYLLRLEDKNVCNGSTHNFKEEVLRVLRDTPLANSVICTLILQQKCSSTTPHWNITFPNVPKPPVKILYLPKPGSVQLRVLHLTDIHIDFKYMVGSKVDCLEPLCCRSNVTNNKEKTAGFWGSLGKCDLPSWTLEYLFSQLSKQQFDYIIWTGDLPSHSSWDQDREQQINIIKYLSKLFKKYFPKIKVYPSIGNHESVPVDGFTQPFIKGNISTSWLYKAIYKSWSAWLPNSTKDNITKCGYYSTIIKPGYRIISLNMNYCHYANFWLLINETDPCSQLQWLIDLLQTSEDNRELVHIIGHIPPGSNDCVEQWSWNYYKIVNRYENIITGQFFGHTHTDSWQMFYDFEAESVRPVSVSYIAPSLTTYVKLNPGFRVYHIDGFYLNSTWYVQDHQTYILNLREIYSTNINTTPIWTKEYSAKVDFEMDCMWPSCWHKLWLKLNNTNLFNKYYRYFFKSNEVVPIESCDSKCRRKMMCDIYNGRSYDMTSCPL